MQKTFCLTAACPVPQFPHQEKGDTGVVVCVTHWGAHPCLTVEYKPLGCHPRVPRCKVPTGLGTSGKVPGFDWNGVGIGFWLPQGHGDIGDDEEYGPQWVVTTWGAWRVCSVCP